LTRSTKGAGPGSQLALPAAPRFDRYGLHAEECECARCALGYRPTVRERTLAVQTWEARQRRELAEAQAAEVDTRAQSRAERCRAREEETNEIIKRITAPVERPATAEELAELRREHGFKPRRR